VDRTTGRLTGVCEPTPGRALDRWAGGGVCFFGRWTVNTPGVEPAGFPGGEEDVGGCESLGGEGFCWGSDGGGGVGVDFCWGEDLGGGDCFCWGSEDGVGGGRIGVDLGGDGFCWSGGAVVSGGGADFCGDHAFVVFGGDEDVGGGELGVGSGGHADIGVCGVGGGELVGFGSGVVGGVRTDAGACAQTSAGGRDGAGGVIGGEVFGAGSFLADTVGEVMKLDSVSCLLRLLSPRCWSGLVCLRFFFGSSRSPMATPPAPFDPSHARMSAFRVMTPFMWSSNPSGTACPRAVRRERIACTTLLLTFAPSWVNTRWIAGGLPVATGASPRVPVCCTTWTSSWASVAPPGW
jgi:hypothetical protein